MIHTGKANLKKTTALWGTASYIESIKRLSEMGECVCLCVPATNGLWFLAKAGDYLHRKQLLFHFKVVSVVEKGSQKLFFCFVYSFLLRPSLLLLPLFLPFLLPLGKCSYVQIAFGCCCSVQLHQQHFSTENEKKCICDKYN